VLCFFPEALPQAELNSGLQPDNDAKPKNTSSFFIHHFPSHSDPYGIGTPKEQYSIFLEIMSAILGFMREDRSLCAVLSLPKQAGVKPRKTKKPKIATQIYFYAIHRLTTFVKLLWLLSILS